jgi:hypothetical protein
VAVSFAEPRVERVGDMWIAVAVVAVTLLIIVALLLPPHAGSVDGPLPPEVEAQVLLGETPEPDDIDDTHDDARP